MTKEINYENQRKQTEMEEILERMVCTHWNAWHIGLTQLSAL